MPMSLPAPEVPEPLLRDHIRTELSRLVSNREFHASDRLRALLRHLVERTLAGEQHQLNQRQLAVSVFGRGENFDPDQDAIVRVEMSKLRRALAEFYARNSSDSSIYIELPKGQYVPRFISRRGESGFETTPTKTVGIRAEAHSPTLTVRTFSGGSENETLLANRLTQELKVTLTQVPFLKVTSGVQDNDDNTDSHTASIRARFLLDGSIQISGVKLRVTSTLHDLRLDQQIWAERLDYDFDPNDVFTLQDHVVRTISAHTSDLYSGVINRTLTQDLDLGKTNGFSTYEAMLYFYRYLNRHSDTSYRMARQAIEDATPREPENPLLLSMLSDLRRAAYALGYTDGPDPLPEVLQLARSAYNLAPDSATCRLSLCYALLQARDRGALLALAEPLLDMRVSSPSHAGDAAMAVAFAGEWEQGCGIIEQIVNPLSTTPHIFAYPLVLRAYRDSNYESAWELTTRFRPSPFFWQPILRAAVLGKLGRAAEAESHVSELLSLRPQITSHGRRYMSCFLFEDDLIAELCDGLAKAGLEIN